MTNIQMMEVKVSDPVVIGATKEDILNDRGRRW